MTIFERYMFNGRCPYTDDPCHKKCDCVNCEVNTKELENLKEVNKIESENKSNAENN